jgi:hypothetical protein
VTMMKVGNSNRASIPMDKGRSPLVFYSAA